MLTGQFPNMALSTAEAMRFYCGWLLEQQTEEGFFRCYELDKPLYEWYMIFYPVRTLLLGGKLLKEEKYIRTALKYVDAYVSEQLPNGAFTSDYRRKPGDQLTKKEFQEILRFGKVNLADNGSNITALLQAVPFVEGEKREKYLNTARKWFDGWAAIWALAEGGYGNGIWVGHKLNSPYTCAISTVASAFSAFGKLTGEYEYIENAERCMRFQCENWTNEADGRPIFLDCYPLPHKAVLNDYSHSFYLLEGMCWTHWVTKDTELKKLLEVRMKSMILGKKGLLSQWANSWFNYMVTAHPWDEEPCEFPATREAGLRLGWEMAKSNGLMHTFLYYLNHIEENPVLREKVDKGLKYLANPLKARMSGVMSDPDESYGAFAVQSTGFAGLSLAEALEKDVVFSLI